MKKVLTLVLALTMLLTLAVGCTSAPSAPSTPSTPSSPSTPSTPSTPSAPADPGKTYEFVVQNWDPASSVCAMFVEVLGGILNERSGGQMEFTYYHGGSLVGAGASLGAIRDGTADMAWLATSPSPGVFSAAETVCLPFNGVTCARMGTEVLMDLYDEYDFVRTPYLDGTVPMAIYVCTTAPLSLTGKKAETLNDLKGLSIRASNEPLSKFLPLAGMTPVTIGAPDTYENLEKNIVQGASNDWHNMNAFKLLEVLNVIMDVPLSHNPLMVMMNKDKYDSLPADLQALVDELWADRWASRLGAEAWDDTRSWILNDAPKYNVEIYDPSSELFDQLAKIGAESHKEYIAYLDSQNLPGQEIYDFVMAASEKYAPQYADPWTNYTSAFIPYREQYFDK